MLLVFVKFAYLVSIQTILMFNATTTMFKSSVTITMATVISVMFRFAPFQFAIIFEEVCVQFFSKSMLPSFCDVIYICHKVYFLNDGAVQQYWCPSF